MMTLKEEVLAVLPEADPEETKVLLEVLAPDATEVTREPAPALVMMNARDCFGTPFHLGEVLVTTARVRGNDRVGHGSILGDEPAKALLLACLDLLDDQQQAIARVRLAPHLERRTWSASRGVPNSAAGGPRRCPEARGSSLNPWRRSEEE